MLGLSISFSSSAATSFRRPLSTVALESQSAARFFLLASPFFNPSSASFTSLIVVRSGSGALPKFGKFGFACGANGSFGFGCGMFCAMSSMPFLTVEDTHQ